MKRLKGTVIPVVLHARHYTTTMSLQAVHPHFCSISFGCGVYPVRNLLLWMNLRVSFRKLNPCEIALRVYGEKKKEIGGRR